MGNGARRPYPPEMRERAVRLVYERRAARVQEYGGFHEIADQLDVHAESIRNWMRQSEVDDDTCLVLVRTHARRSHTR